MKSKLLSVIALLGLGAVLPCQAGVHTFSDFTRPANAASLVETFDFVPNEGWSGTPPNIISGEASVYLKMTVSWAAASNIGTFSARFNQADDGASGRWSIGSDGSGFGFLTGNGTADPDGTGPATAKPTVVAYDKTANTSVTLVLKVTVDTRPFAETVENSPSNDTTHWKNNGKSMYRIGKGMGDGMVNLLNP